MAFVYSCCFWFSLRLGGILIGIFSLLQAALLLITCTLAYSHTKEVRDGINYWINNYNLIYATEYVKNFKEDPSKHIVFVIILTFIYIFVCLLFIYGAYKCNNVLMVAYILLELLRLIVISTLIATGLLLLKQNTMDIGILIGASVAGGFLLLGMFYLWICSANLPVLINEMERDDQADTITKLRQLLEANNQRNDATGLNSTYINREANIRKSKVFMIPNNKMRYITPKAAPAQISVGY